MLFSYCYNDYMYICEIFNCVNFNRSPFQDLETRPEHLKRVWTPVESVFGPLFGGGGQILLRVILRSHQLQRLRVQLQSQQLLSKLRMKRGMLLCTNVLFKSICSIYRHSGSFPFLGRMPANGELIIMYIKTVVNGFFVLSAYQQFLLL